VAGREKNQIKGHSVQLKDLSGVEADQRGDGVNEADGGDPAGFGREAHGLDLAEKKLFCSNSYPAKLHTRTKHS
jgi:hypothetical protein